MLGVLGGESPGGERPRGRDGSSAFAGERECHVLRAGLGPRVVVPRGPQGSACSRGPSPVCWSNPDNSLLNAGLCRCHLAFLSVICNAFIKNVIMSFAVPPQLGYACRSGRQTLRAHFCDEFCWALCERAELFPALTSPSAAVQEAGDEGLG